MKTKPPTTKTVGLEQTVETTETPVTIPESETTPSFAPLQSAEERERQRRADEERRNRERQAAKRAPYSAD